MYLTDEKNAHPKKTITCEEIRGSAEADKASLHYRNRKHCNRYVFFLVHLKVSAYPSFSDRIQQPFSVFGRAAAHRGVREIAGKRERETRISNILWDGGGRESVPGEGMLFRAGGHGAQTLQGKEQTSQAEEQGNSAETATSEMSSASGSAWNNQWQLSI